MNNKHKNSSPADDQLDLFDSGTQAAHPEPGLRQVNDPDKFFPTTVGLENHLREFREFGMATQIARFPDPKVDIPVYINEFWTSKQRAAHSIHEISYRACFKPQLPRFFIQRLTRPGDIVYDPFMGRGTTLVETGLTGRIPAGCDINPLSKILVMPRMHPPSLQDIILRVNNLNLAPIPVSTDDPKLAFYHPKTLGQILALKNHLQSRFLTHQLDLVDAWIQMVATNRLTGHSNGFFSVYTLPPNQATSVEAQRKINAKRNQIPPERDIKPILIKKSKSLLKDVSTSEVPGECPLGEPCLILTGSCENTPQIKDNSVALVVTSPPFLNVVNYQTDNWLRCWFNDLDAKTIKIWQLSNPQKWVEAMSRVFAELYRILKPGGYIAFEVGEVRRGSILMENLVVPAAQAAHLIPLFVLINDQKFTKTANCWGIENLKKGTNTNRIIVLTK